MADGKKVLENIVGFVVIAGLAAVVYKTGLLNRFFSSKEAEIRGLSRLSPKETIECFYDYRKEGNRNGLLACLDEDSDAYKRVKKSLFPSPLKDKDIVIEKQYADNNEAIIRVKEKDLSPDGKQIYFVWDLTYYLRKENDTWKIYKIETK